MVAVDTSVWVDLLRGRQTIQVESLEELVTGGHDVAVPDVVLMELLAGVRDESAANRLESRLREFWILSVRSAHDFVLAAELSRLARRAGITVASRLGFLIAAPCVRVGVPLLHADSDFDRLASCTPLEVY